MFWFAKQCNSEIYHEKQQGATPDYATGLDEYYLDEKWMFLYFVAHCIVYFRVCVCGNFVLSVDILFVTTVWYFNLHVLIALHLLITWDACYKYRHTNVNFWDRWQIVVNFNRFKPFLNGII